MKKIINKYLSELKSGINLMFKEFFNKETNKKQRANMWTFSRLVTSFLIPICSLLSILTSNVVLFGASIAVTGFGAITDFFDGRSARKHKSSSEFGRKLDQVADKVFSMMVGINVSLFNPLFLIPLLGEVLIATTNGLYKINYKNLEIKSTLIGKIKQWPLSITLIFGLISIILPNLAVVTNSLIALTAISQLATVASYIKINNESVKKLKKKEITEYIEYLDQNLENGEDNVNKKELSNKTISTNVIDKRTSRKQQYEDLINLRNELTSNDTYILDESNYQKTKK